MAKHTDTNEDIILFFNAYMALRGQDTFPEFSRNVAKFHECLFDALILGEGDRHQAWVRWVGHIGSLSEATRYFQAIDSVHPYT